MPSPYLLYSDANGKIFEDRTLYVTGRTGWDAVAIPAEEWIELVFTEPITLVASPTATTSVKTHL